MSNPKGWDVQGWLDRLDLVIQNLIQNLFRIWGLCSYPQKIIIFLLLFIIFFK
jgi:hypothetical protein